MRSFYFILRMLKKLSKHLLFVHDSRVFNFVRHSEGRKSLKIDCLLLFRNYSALCGQDCYLEKKEQERREQRKKRMKIWAHCLY